MTPRKPKPVTEIVILAGGLSSRMDRDKSRIRLGRRTILDHVRALAAQLHLPVRVLRRDAVPRCGPLGGIYTALTRSRADALLFLACDMPFVSPAFLKKMLKTFRREIVRATNLKLPQPNSSPSPPMGERAGERWHVLLEPSQPRSKTKRSQLKRNVSFAIFASHNQLIGLPSLLHRETALALVSRQIEKSQLSLQSLARALKAKSLTPSRQPSLQLMNINTPPDLQIARQKMITPKSNV